MTHRGIVFATKSSVWLGGTMLLVMVLLYVGVAAPAHAAASSGTANFSIRPAVSDPAHPVTRSYYVLSLEPGTTTTWGALVTNTGTATGVVHLYAVDATTGQTGGTVFRAQQDVRRDVGAWLSLDTSQVTLAPGQSALVHLQLAIPAGVRAGQHVGGIVAESATSQGATSQDQHFQVKVEHQFIMAVQVNLPGQLVEQLTASAIQAGGANHIQSLYVQLQNTGTMMVNGKGSLSVTDAHGTLLQHLPVIIDTFLPATSIAYPVNVQKLALAAGDYQASVDIVYGNGHTLHYITTLTITADQVQHVFQPTDGLQAPVSAATGLTLSPWLAIPLGLLLLASLGYWSWKLAIALRRKRG